MWRLAVEFLFDSTTSGLEYQFDLSPFTLVHMDGLLLDIAGRIASCLF
jgi:hypothetical protein